MIGADEFFAAEDAAARDLAKPNGHWPPAEPHALPAIDAADVVRWRGIEPPELLFTIEDLVPQGMVTLLTGQGGAGKTLLLQTAGTAIAAASGSVLGKRAVAGAAAGVFAEDPESVLHIRQPRINSALGIDYDRIAGRYFPQSYFGLPAQLWRDGKPTDFLAELEDRLSRISNLRLLTLDNAAVLYSGDENSRPEVTAFISALNGLADRLAIGLVLSAHPSKSQDGTALRVTSGTTAWVNTCRSVIEIRPAEKEQGPALTVVKANHAATGTTIELEWQDKLLVPLAPAGGIIESIKHRTCERVFLDLLHDAEIDGRKLSESKNAPNYAPKMFAANPRKEGFKVRDFEAAMTALFARKEIKMGGKNDRDRRLIRTEGAMRSVE